MSDYLSSELAATCAALGFYDGKRYHLDTHGLDVIKDLIKYLKRDDDNHTVRRFLGRTKVLQSDLVKIFIDHSDKRVLWDVLLRLLINLTSPVFLIYNEQIPTEKSHLSIYHQLVSYSQDYKVALGDDRIWIAVSKRLEDILKVDSSERGEENETIIERLLIFVRNVLQIPPDENEKRLDNDSTIHDQVLFALNTSSMADLLSFIASNRNEQQYHMQILEIISLLLRDQNARQLATSGFERSEAEKGQDEKTLLAALQKEKQSKLERVRKYTAARHSRFGGTYVVQNMKAIGENQLLCHKPYQKIEALQFGQDKQKAGKPKNRRPVSDPRGERTSILSVRLFLKEFCVEFLNAAYNPVMKYARSYVMSNPHGEVFETSCYLRILRFFMEFNRHYKFEVKYVSETISVESFHLVQRQMEHYCEMMLTDKKRIPIWSQRLHLALKAYEELLHTLLAMDKSPDRNVRESSRVIKSNVFYVPEYRETILSQLLAFDELKMSRQYLVDLTTTAHIFLKMLANFCGKGGRSLVVQKLKKKRKKKANRQKNTKEAVAPTLTLEERWDGISFELPAVMRHDNIPQVVPFDATLDTPVDDQKTDAMKRIQKFLRTKYLDEAVGLIRAAREVWPENDCFGKANISPEEEFATLREIFFADLGVIEEDSTMQATSNQGENAENSLDLRAEDDDEDEEDEEEEGGFVTEETNFNFSEFIHRFANVKIVKAMLILLRQFDTNTDEVNHYVNKMLHRIAWDCKMPGMMFQASMFRVFQRILESKHPSHEELQKFAVFIIRRFTETAQKNQKAYMELLFWKTTRDATMVVEGYTDNPDADNKKVSRSLWTEEEEDELRTLFMDHQTNNYPQDVIDWILEHINQNRTRRGIIKKLKELCLVVNSKAVRSEIQKRLPKEWSEEEVAQLTELWEELKIEEDPVDMIFAGLRIKRPKPKIKEKLLELGLAKDRKELRKKRSRKSNHGKSSWETQSVSNSDEDEDTDEDGEKSSRRNSTAPNKPTDKRTKKTTKKPTTMVYTDAQLSGLFKDVIEKNMTEALEWIKESLEDAVEDRDEESFEGIPLVPVTDHCSDAMDSPSFQKLVRALGLSPPADEQESYWRIPANMLTSMIQKRCNLIEDALAGNFIVEEVQTEMLERDPDDDDKNNSSDDDGDVLENLKKYFTAKEPVPSTSYACETETNVQLAEKQKKKSTVSAKTRKRTDNVEITGKSEAQYLPAHEKPKNEKKKIDASKKVLETTSQSEENVATNGDIKKGAMEKKKKKLNRKKALETSSESEMEITTNDNNEEEATKKDKKNLNRKNVLESSSESEMEITTNDNNEEEATKKDKKNLNRKNVLESSSDSEMEITTNDNNKESMEKDKKSPNHLKKALQESSDSEAEIKSNADNQQKTLKKERKKFGGRKVFAESSDSEGETNTDINVQRDETKRERSDSSDKENETIKRRRLLDSDEEEESLPTRKNEPKRAHAIITDDEDD